MSVLQNNPYEDHLKMVYSKLLSQAPNRLQNYLAPRPSRKLMGRLVSANDLIMSSICRLSDERPDHLELQTKATTRATILCPSQVSKRAHRRVKQASTEFMEAVLDFHFIRSKTKRQLDYAPELSMS